MTSRSKGGRPVQLTYPRSVEVVQLKVPVPVELKRAMYERAVESGRPLYEEVRAALTAHANRVKA
jgi:hypothetical protein